MTDFSFSPAKFSVLALSAVAVALGTTGMSSTHQPSSAFSLSSLYRPADEAVVDSGTLTSNFFLTASFTPAPITPGTERPGNPPSLPTPQQPTIRHSYPPLAR